MIPPARPLPPDAILAVYAEGPTAVLRLVEHLQAHIEGQQQTIEELRTHLDGLTAQVTALQQRLARNSHNSHQPPSSDGPAHPPRLARPRSGRQPGGQPGHRGHALRFSARPDRVVVHRPPACPACGQSLAAAPASFRERHQIIDLPPLALETVEHQTVCCTCPGCGAATVGTFPPDAQTLLGYGPRLLALGVYLTGYQLLPYARASALLTDLFGAGPGPGTLYQAVQTAATRLAPAEQVVRARLQAAAVVHCDETGINIGGQHAWLHVASTAALTLYGAHRQRGTGGSAALGVLPGFTGTAVHDSYASYRRYGCRHALCNAHLLRELQAVVEMGGQGWARQVQRLLGCMKRAAERARAAGAASVAAPAATTYRARYRALLGVGLARNPPRVAAPGQRGRVKQSKATNLVLRMQEQEEAVLRFLTDGRVPFDNNQAERDLRMVKVQQKIGGCFRSAAGAAGYSRVRGYISTLRKQGAGVLSALEQVFCGNPVVLCLA